MPITQKIHSFFQLQKTYIKADLLRLGRLLFRRVQVRVIAILVFFLLMALASQGGYEQGLRHATFLAENKLYPATPHYPEISFEVFRSGEFVQYDCPKGGDQFLSANGQPTGFCHKP